MGWFHCCWTGKMYNWNSHNTISLQFYSALEWNSSMFSSVEAMLTYHIHSTLKKAQSQFYNCTFVKSPPGSSPGTNTTKLKKNWCKVDNTFFSLFLRFRCHWDNRRKIRKSRRRVHSFCCFEVWGLFVFFFLLDSDASLEITCIHVNHVVLIVRGKQVANCKLTIPLQNLVQTTSTSTVIDDFKRHVTTLNSDKFTASNTTDLQAFW